MTDTTSRTATGQDQSRGTAKTQQKEPARSTSPESRGRTTIDDSVVEKIAGMATREVPGIYNLGAGMARTFGGVRERVGGAPSVTRGVKVEVGEHQTAVDLDVVVEYGVPIPEVAGDARNNVISAVERMTGLEVVEVNVAVDDVHLPDEERESESEGRVA